MIQILLLFWERYCLCVFLFTVLRSLRHLWNCVSQPEHSVYFPLLHGVCTQDHRLWSTGEWVFLGLCVATMYCSVKIREANKNIYTYLFLCLFSVLNEFNHLKWTECPYTKQNKKLTNLRVELYSQKQLFIWAWLSTRLPCIPHFLRQSMYYTV